MHNSDTTDFSDWVGEGQLKDVHMVFHFSVVCCLKRIYEYMNVLVILTLRRNVCTPYGTTFMVKLCFLATILCYSDYTQKR